MKSTYSLYEAKAKFSAIVRQVREGRAVTVHGEPVVEIRPITQAKPGLDRRIESLEAAGELTRATKRFKARMLERRPGALKRFLAERD